MKKSIVLSLFAVAVLLISSCKNLQPITKSLKQNYNISQEQLKHVQYYLSDDIVLQRKITDGNNLEIASGKIKIVNGEKVEEVIFHKRTPGVLLTTPTDERLGVAFEDGDSRYLMFIPNPERQGKYVLAAADWRNGVGKVNYDGRSFYCTPESGKAYLLIDITKLSKYERNVRKASGRKLNEDGVKHE